MSNGPGRSSTALLTEIVETALEPGYAAAAAARADAEGSAPRRGAGRSLAVLAGTILLGLFLGVAAVVADASDPQQTQSRSDLVAEVEESSAQVAELQETATTLRAEVTALQRELLLTTDEDPAQLLDLEVAAATVAVTGPGLEVRIDDAVSTPAGQDPALSRVLDSDLQAISNSLFNAGAEAIAINDQRLSSLTAIRGAGEAILVNYRPLTRPYVVQAIGDPLRLEAAFAQSPAGVGLRTLTDSYGIRSEVRPAESLRLPGAAAATLSEASVAP
jgi:uncharacterized protein YlxW (UPF0749 family)